MQPERHFGQVREWLWRRDGSGEHGVTDVSDRWRHGAPSQSDVAGVPGFELPQSLAYLAAGDGDGDPAWARWIAGLPGIVDDLARRWSLRVGR